MTNPDQQPWAPDPDRGVGTPPDPSRGTRGERGTSVFDGNADYFEDGSPKAEFPKRGPQRATSRNYGARGSAEGFGRTGAGTTEAISATGVLTVDNAAPREFTPLTFVANLDSVSDFAVTGTVSFQRGNVEFGNAPVATGSEDATYTHTAGFAAGTHNVTAVYSGNDRFQPLVLGPVTVTASLTPPPTPTGLAATAGDTTVTLNWNANVPPPPVDGYRLYRSTGGGTAVLIATIPSGTTTFTDTGLSNNTTYSYTIDAYNTGGSSAQSAPVTATPQPPAPPTPTGLTATAGDANVALAWNAVAPPVDGYRLYRSVGAGASVLHATITAPTTTYSDTGLTNGTTYTYAISAYNTGGESARSTTVSATPTAPPPPTV